jgi:pimeloyl-ACP methyl ester carboxylesterase
MTMATWVLLRGLTREGAHWGDFPAQLGAVLPASRILTVDLPGAGQLRHRRCPISVEAMVGICRAQLHAAAAPSPYVLLGLSLGGMVAAAWAAAHPAEVAGCVLVNTSMRPFSSPQDRLKPRNWLSLLRLLMPTAPRRAEEAILALTSSSPQQHAQVVAEWVAIRQARPVAAANALRQLGAAARYRHPGPAPRMPVLVLASARDALVDPRCSAEMARRWQVEFDLHPDAGHDLPLDASRWLALRLARWAGREATD